jgi:hypothetical protein
MSEIPGKLIQVYFNRFINRTDVYNYQWCDQINYGYTAVHGPVTLELIALHLGGQVTLSFPALSKESMCKWCCWDSDKSDGKLDRLQALLSQYGWIIVREGRREGRDGHLWLFFDDPVPAADLIRFAAVFQKAAGIASGQLEFFPKQSKAPVGSSVRGPLGIHLKPGAKCVRGWFDDAPQDVIAQLEWLSLQVPNSAATFIKLAEELRLRELANRRLPARSNRRQASGQRGVNLNANILALVPETRRIGQDFVAQCPLCAAEGHDLHKDNLRISADGKKFCCVYGGPGLVHIAPDIIRALRGAIC